MPRIAVLGGTFDPPHIGHLVLGECVAEQFECERVLFVPAGDPYRKTGTRNVTPADLRVEMVRLAIAGNPRFDLDDREVRRAGPSYTVETLRALRAEGHDDLVLILGSDAVADMPNWREPDELPRLARLVVAEKPPGSGTGGFESVNMPHLGISSTLIRARVASGESIRYLVPDPVRELIEGNRLYLE